jgi:hypothetical protein
MATRRQFSLQAIFLAVSYFALAFAWLSACVLRHPTAAFRPGPLCVLSAVVALVAWRRTRGDPARANGLCLIVVATHLAAAGLVGQVVAVLQTISSEGTIDWEWFRTTIGGTVVGNLVWPLFALLPATAAYLNHRMGKRTSSAKWLMTSLVVGVASATAAIAAIAVLFRTACSRW